jgi:hypothetical protein
VKAGREYRPAGCSPEQKSTEFQTPRMDALSHQFPKLTNRGCDRLELQGRLRWTISSVATKMTWYDIPPA